VAQVPAAPPGQSASPVQPEKQPPLDVDRDPVAAPEEPQTAAPGQNPSSTIGRDNGRYTLQRNVDEVVLNATVLDDKQHMVTTLAKDDFSTRTSPYRSEFWSIIPAPCAPSGRQ
jgi:hypothetical protein